MTCVICEQQAREISSVGQFQVKHCQGCGFYGMPGELFEHLGATGKRFNVERTRAFLTTKIQCQQPPWISIEETSTHSLIEQSSAAVDHAKVRYGKSGH